MTPETPHFLKSDSEKYVRSVVLDILLTVLLIGAWNLVVQYYHCKTLNYLLGTKRYSFGKLILFSILTLGVYYIYHEYKKATDFAKLTGETDSTDPIFALIASLLAFGWVYDAFLQDKMNRVLEGKRPLPPATAG